MPPVGLGIDNVQYPSLISDPLTSPETADESATQPRYALPTPNSEINYALPLTPLQRRHGHLRRSRIPRSIGSNGNFLSSPSPDLPASIYRGEDNPLSPSSPWAPPPIFGQDEDEGSVLDGFRRMKADLEFDPASETELRLTDDADDQEEEQVKDHGGVGHYGNLAQRLTRVLGSTASYDMRGKSVTPSRDNPAQGLLSPPILWKRNFGSGMSPLGRPGPAGGEGPMQLNDPFASPVSYSHSHTYSPLQPSPTLPSTPVQAQEAGAMSTATSANTHGNANPTANTNANASAEGSDAFHFIPNNAAAPLFAASVALSVVLGVLIVGLATCGIVKARRRKRRMALEAKGPNADDGDGPDGQDQTPSRVLPSQSKQTLPPSRSSMSFSASPSFATAPSFHTMQSASSMVGPNSSMSHPQSILLHSHSAASIHSASAVTSTGIHAAVPGNTHARRISFVDVPANSIEDLHRQLYAPPGWQGNHQIQNKRDDGCVAREDGLEDQDDDEGVDVGEYQPREPYKLRAVQYVPEPQPLNIVPTESTDRMSWHGSGTQLESIQEEDSACGSQSCESAESYSSLAYHRDLPDDAGAREAYEHHSDPRAHEFVLPSIPSIASQPLIDGISASITHEQLSITTVSVVSDARRREADGGEDSESRRSSVSSLDESDDSSFARSADCGDSTLSTVAPGTPRASSSEPSLRAFAYDDKPWDISDLYDDEDVPMAFEFNQGLRSRTSSSHSESNHKRISGMGINVADAGWSTNSNSKKRLSMFPQSGVGIVESEDDNAGDERDIDEDEISGYQLRYHESVLGSLLTLEENEMDRRRAEFAPRHPPYEFESEDFNIDQAGTDLSRRSSTSSSSSSSVRGLKVKRSRSFPARLFGRLDDSAVSDDIPVPADSHRHSQKCKGKQSRHTEIISQNVLRRAFRAIRQTSKATLMSTPTLPDPLPVPTATGDSPSPPPFRRFSGAEWDDLDDFDPYYTEVEEDEGEQSGDGDSVDEDQDGNMNDQDQQQGGGRGERRFTGQYDSEMGHTEAHFGLEAYDFPEPSNHLPHIRITSH